MRLVFGFPVSQARVNHWSAANRSALAFKWNRFWQGLELEWLVRFGLGMHSRFILSKNRWSVHSCPEWPASGSLKIFQSRR